jgi:hypothetical protein
MFNWFKKKKQEDEGIEYSFIWYKKLESGNKTFYTQPFRTKVRAKSFEEAKEKIRDIEQHFKESEIIFKVNDLLALV